MCECAAFGVGTGGGIHRFMHASSEACIGTVLTSKRGIVSRYIGVAHDAAGDSSFCCPRQNEICTVITVHQAQRIDNLGLAMHVVEAVD